MTWGFDAIDRRFRPAEPVRLQCLNCETTTSVEMENARTAYHFEGLLGSPDDPNRPIPLCRACAKEHHEYWDEMWTEYQRSVMP